jgi:23S rRNA pseudouridine1911/1915/1917 synthase
MRLDRAVAQHVAGLSRTRAQAAIEAGEITVDDRRVKSSLLLEPGMTIRMRTRADISMPAPRTSPETPAVPLCIVYEDEHLLVLDKPAGLVVHPAPGHPSGTLVDALLAYLPGLRTTEDTLRPGIVHRLDKDTSGLMIVAKTPESHQALALQMREHRITKRYLALIEGELPAPEGVVEAPIGRDPRTRQRMALVSMAAGGREARTRFRVLRVMRGRSLVELELETGRTHQIRVHMAAVRHPIVGDPTYGRPQPPLPPRQFLHAAELEFAHPVTGERLTFSSPLPDDLASFLATWERRNDLAT